MNTIRERMDEYLSTVVHAERLDPSPIPRFHCWHTTDRVPYSVYGWKGDLLYTSLRERDVYIWIGSRGAVYLTGISSICNKRPRSTIQSSVVTEMNEIVYNSFVVNNQ